jgi:hypothetical protein
MRTFLHTGVQAHLNMMRTFEGLTLYLDVMLYNDSKKSALIKCVLRIYCCLGK